MSRLSEVPADYRREYERGWAAAARYARAADPGARSPLDNPRSDDWVDGYMDQSIGREKWHMWFCTNHETCGKA
jgi:hypothetical protein